MKTFFIDIDGTIICNEGSGQLQQLEAWCLNQSEIQTFLTWCQRNGHYVVLTTSRKEALRAQTVKQLADLRLLYDQLVMGLPPGDRWVVNDRRTDGSSTAFALSHDRNTTTWIKELMR